MRFPALLLFLLALFVPLWAEDAPTPPAEGVAPTAPAAPVETIAEAARPKEEDGDTQAAPLPPPVQKIKPTAGRVVLVTQHHLNAPTEVLPAIITHVHSDICVSVVMLSAFGINGESRCALSRTSLMYEDAIGTNAGDSWSWMPYQLGQAAKTAEVIAAKPVTADEASTAQVAALTARVDHLTDVLRKIVSHHGVKFLPEQLGL